MGRPIPHPSDPTLVPNMPRSNVDPPPPLSPSLPESSAALRGTSPGLHFFIGPIRSTRPPTALKRHQIHQPPISTSGLDSPVPRGTHPGLGISTALAAQPAVHPFCTPPNGGAFPSRRTGPAPTPLLHSRPVSDQSRSTISGPRTDQPRQDKLPPPRHPEASSAPRSVVANLWGTDRDPKLPRPTADTGSALTSPLLGASDGSSAGDPSVIPATPRPAPPPLQEFARTT